MVFMCLFLARYFRNYAKKNVIKILKLKKNFPFGIKIIKNGISFVG